MEERLFAKIKSKLIMFILASIFFIVVGLVMLFFVSDKKICLCVSFIGLIFGIYAFMKYFGKNKENTYFVTADCVDRSRSGYRKQYLEYYFKTDDGRSFTIKTAQKEKFKKGMRYNLCFKKDKNKEQSEEITGFDLLEFELCSVAEN